MNLIETLKSLPVATVYEAAGKLGDVAPSIRPMIDGIRLAGPAFTLKTMLGWSGRVEVGLRLGLAVVGLTLIEQLFRRAHAQGLSRRWRPLPAIAGSEAG